MVSNQGWKIGGFVTILCLSFGTFSFIVTIYSFWTLNKFVTSDGNTSNLTLETKIATISFVAGVICYLLSIVAEFVNANKSIKQIRADIKTQYDEICEKYKVYPNLKSLIPNHYCLLTELSTTSENYKTNDNYQNIFCKYVTFWFNNFIDKSFQECRGHLLNFQFCLKNRDSQLFQSFIGMFWDSVNQNGEINITSIVDPGPQWFWESHSAYLKQQESLIRKKGIIMNYRGLKPAVS